MQERNFWGWGYSDFKINEDAFKGYKNMLRIALEVNQFEDVPLPKLEAIKIPDPKFQIPSQLTSYCTDNKLDRLSHTYGKSFRDVWRGMHGIYPCPPCYIAYPHSEDDISAIYKFAADNAIAVIPYGGGSSVVGGVEVTRNSRYAGSISVDMKNFDKVLEVDPISRTARIQGGCFGPAIESELKKHNLTLRHYPQSFEFSTLGGWIATRSGGHFATLFTHIDEFVESVRVISPKGIMQTRRLPGSGAGPSEERFISGTEGAFGIITEAWVRLQDIPKFKQSITVNFKDFYQGVEASRSIAQSGLHPSNARLVSPLEALSNGLGDGMNSVLILGFESSSFEVQAKMNMGLSICKQFGGEWSEAKSSAKEKASDKWKSSFLQAPYLRDRLIQLGFIVETFETAITWDKFRSFHNEIEHTVKNAAKAVCGKAIVTVRFTHLYPDGPAPYYTVIAHSSDNKQMEHWDFIKKEVSTKLIELGGTITHHHAVGKDHLHYYEQQQSKIFQKSLFAIKKEMDPAWILNPGTLLSVPEE